jgi:signal peptidase I
MGKVKSQSSQKINKQIFVLIIYLAIIMILTSLFITLINEDSNTNFFGYTARLVISGSMEPEIKTNSINIVKICDIDDIDIGDIVCFNYNQDIVHRVIEITYNDNGEKLLHTQGDANSNPDSIEINNDMLVGKVIKTFNGTAEIMNKYSLEPGKIDTNTLVKNMIFTALLIGVIVIAVTWIVEITILFIKAFYKKDNLDKYIDRYINEIDDLLIYRELLLEIRDQDVKNDKDNRLEFICNRLSRAKAVMGLRTQHQSLKEFKKEINHCILIKNLGIRLDKEESGGVEETLSSIIKRFNNSEESSE